MSYLARTDTTTCRRCRKARENHDGDRCPDPSRLGMYGPDNPWIQWLREHDPKALEEPAQTVYRPEEEKR